MKFEKRDIILIVGLFLIMIGLVPFIAPIYSAIVVSLLYIGIKLYIERQRKSVKDKVGRAICMECGSSIKDKDCPNCNP